MGYRSDSLGGAVAAITLTTAIGLPFSWLGAAIAARSANPTCRDALDVLAVPLMLASTAFTPAETMPGWLDPSPPTSHSVAADAVRGPCEGGLDRTDLAISLVWTIGLLTGFVPLSVRLYRMGAR